MMMMTMAIGVFRFKGCHYTKRPLFQIKYSLIQHFNSLAENKTSENNKGESFDKCIYQCN